MISVASAREATSILTGNQRRRMEGPEDPAPFSFGASGIWREGDCLLVDDPYTLFPVTAQDHYWCTCHGWRKERPLGVAVPVEPRA